MKKRIIIALIVFSGIFYYKTILPGQFHQSQFSFFIFCGGILGSLVLYEKNKWIGYMAGLASLMFLKSYLTMLGPKYALFETTLIGIFIFGIYFASRHLKLTKEHLKWFLVPAILNITLILVQRFDHTQSILTVPGITGFLGSTGKVGCFFALTTPLFLEFIPILFPLLLLAIILCKSSIALAICIVSTLVYLGFKNKKLFRIAILILSIASILLVIDTAERKREIGDFGQRMSFWIGTLDGIKHNPVFGWGIGNFENVWNRIPQAETIYWKPYACNYNTVKGAEKIMNHPHNEVLLWWWFMGIGFPILFIGLCRDLIRKFTREKILSFSILVAGFICIMGYFLSYPAWILLLISLGIYENREVCNGKGKKGSQEGS